MPPSLQGALSATAAGATIVATHGQPFLRRGFLLSQIHDPRRCGRDDPILGCADGADRRRADLLRSATDRRVCARHLDPNQALNIANITDPSNTEGALIAAMFAAQGYIVVAPNYAGYDISTLGLSPVPQRGAAVGRNDGYPCGRAHRAPQHLYAGHQRQRAIVPDRLFRGRPRRHGDAARARSRRRQGHGRRADVGSLRARGLRRHCFLRRRRFGFDGVRAAARQQLPARLLEHQQTPRIPSSHRPIRTPRRSCRAPRPSIRYSRRACCRRRRCSTAPRPRKPNTRWFRRH